MSDQNVPTLADALPQPVAPPAPVEVPAPQPQPRPEPAPAPAPAPQPGPEDNRQAWYCVDVYGPPTGHPMFRSDAHLSPDGSVTCPTCGGRSVQKADIVEAMQARISPPDTRFPLWHPQNKGARIPS